MNPVLLFVLIGAALAVPYGDGRPRPQYPGYGFSGPSAYYYKPQPRPWPINDFRTSRYTYRGPYGPSQYQPYSVKNTVEDDEDVIILQDEAGQFQAGPYDMPLGPIGLNVRRPVRPLTPQGPPAGFSPSAYGPKGYTKLTPYLISLKKPVGTVGEKDPLDNPIIYQIAKVTRGRMAEGEDQNDDEEVDDESEEEEEDEAQDDFIPTFDAPAYAPQSYNIMKENFMKSKQEKQKKKVNSRAMTLARSGMMGPYRRSPYNTYYQTPMRYGTPVMMPMRVQNRNGYVQQRPVYSSRPYTRPYAQFSPAVYQRYGPSVPSTRRNYVQLKNKPVIYNINPYSQMIMPQRKM